MSLPEHPTLATPPRREIKSFVRREGRITVAQKDALQSLWPRYGLDAPAPTATRTAAPNGVIPAQAGIQSLLDARHLPVLDTGLRRYDEGASAANSYHLAALFGRMAPTIFEIGFGAGEALLARAEAAPEKNFIGVEVHRPGVGRVLNRAEKLGLGNLRVACHDAVEVLRDWLPVASLDEVIIEFPDPWHKTRHHKRRLIQPGFLALLAERLKPGGLLRLATDWQNYAEHMLATLQAAPGFENLSATGDYVARPPSRPITRFEARGERLGHRVFDLLARRL